MSALTTFDAAQWAVLAGGAVLISLILWYFFGERERTAAAERESSVQQTSASPRGRGTDHSPLEDK